jgi:hypothetical protein
MEVKFKSVRFESASLEVSVTEVVRAISRIAFPQVTSSPLA